MSALNLTVDECIQLAKEWSRGITLHADSQGWRVTCMLLACEVERLRELDMSTKPEKVDTFAGRVYGIDISHASETGGCVWTVDDDGTWETACGEAWQFTCDGPEENNFRFCHGCGKPVAIAAAPAPGGGPINSNNQTRISDEN